MKKRRASLFMQLLVSRGFLSLGHVRLRHRIDDRYNEIKHHDDDQLLEEPLQPALRLQQESSWRKAITI